MIAYVGSCNLNISGGHQNGKGWEMCNIISLSTVICIWRVWDTRFAIHLNLHNAVINNWSSYTDMMSGYRRCISKAAILNCCSKDTSLKFVRDNLSKSSVVQAELCTFITGGGSISTHGEIILPFDTVTILHRQGL